MAGLLKRMAVAAMVLALPVTANANVWKVSGIFSDGTTLTGWFALNVYGFLANADLKTQPDGVFTGATYSNATSSFSNTATTIDISPAGYLDDLHLVFASDPTTATTSVSLLTASYECRGSGYCYNASAGNIRYLVIGIATIPEPASWLLMIGGFGLVGSALRRRRDAGEIVAACQLE